MIWVCTAVCSDLFDPGLRIFYVNHFGLLFKIINFSSYFTQWQERKEASAEYDFSINIHE